MNKAMKKLEQDCRNLREQGAVDEQLVLVELSEIEDLLKLAALYEETNALLDKYRTLFVGCLKNGLCKEDGGHDS